MSISKALAIGTARSGWINPSTYSRRFRGLLVATIKKGLNAVNNIVPQFFEIPRRIRFVFDDSTLSNIKWKVLCLLSRRDEDHLFITGNSEP